LGAVAGADALLGAPGATRTPALVSSAVRTATSGKGARRLGRHWAGGLSSPGSTSMGVGPNHGSPATPGTTNSVATAPTDTALRVWGSLDGEPARGARLGEPGKQREGLLPCDLPHHVGDSGRVHSALRPPLIRRTATVCRTQVVGVLPGTGRLGAEGGEDGWRRLGGGDGYPDRVDHRVSGALVEQGGRQSVPARPAVDLLAPNIPLE
jgi:hypothetical protein